MQDFSTSILWRVVSRARKNQRHEAKQAFVSCLDLVWSFLCGLQERMTLLNMHLPPNASLWNNKESWEPVVKKKGLAAYLWRMWRRGLCSLDVCLWLHLNGVQSWLYPGVKLRGLQSLPLSLLICPRAQKWRFAIFQACKCSGALLLNVDIISWGMMNMASKLSTTSLCLGKSSP